MKKLLIMTLVPVLTVVALIVAFTILDAKPKSINMTELSYQVMSDEWAEQYTTIEPGQFITQFSIPGEAAAENLAENVSNEFDAISVWAKVDWNKKNVVIALRNPDGTFFQKFPTCPPFCDYTDVASK